MSHAIAPHSVAVSGKRGARGVRCSPRRPGCAHASAHREVSNLVPVCTVCDAGCEWQCSECKLILCSRACARTAPHRRACQLRVRAANVLIDWTRRHNARARDSANAPFRRDVFFETLKAHPTIRERAPFRFKFLRDDGLESLRSTLPASWSSNFLQSLTIEQLNLIAQQILAIVVALDDDAKTAMIMLRTARNAVVFDALRYVLSGCESTVKNEGVGVLMWHRDNFAAVDIRRGRDNAIEQAAKLISGSVECAVCARTIDLNAASTRHVACASGTSMCTTQLPCGHAAHRECKESGSPCLICA